MTIPQIETLVKEQEVSLKITLRPQQIEACVDILKTFLIDEIKNYILEAPTGSGKSVIGIVVSRILNKFMKRGYMITSDLMLQDQYTKTCINYNVDFADVKGVDNYLCNKNKQKHSIGECHLLGLKPDAIKKLDCWKTCPYYSAKEEALRTSTSILNYSYWLIQLDYVKKNAKYEDPMRMFTERDFTIFDEAHKIPDIVQSHFSPRFNSEIETQLLILDDFFKIKDTQKFLNAESHVYMFEDKEKLLAELEIIHKIYKDYESRSTKIKEYVELLTMKNQPLPEKVYKIARAADFVSDLNCKIEDYIGFIKETGLVSMLKNQKSEDELTFNFINEFYLIRKNLLNVSKYRLFMSATLGKQYPEVIGLAEKEYVYKSIDSDFEFKDSSIFFYPGIKLNFKSKGNYVELVKVIDRVLEMHDGDRGIIHTANYEIMEYIKEHSKNKTRLLAYKGSKLKDDALRLHEKGSNTVLIGPSLMEGLDLKDDLSRFQIIAKIPYPSLGDTFIKYKFQNNKEWYQWVTQLKIQQALGRSIRHKHDFSVSYILDDNLIHFVDNFPEYITNRLQILE